MVRLLLLVWSTMFDTPLQIGSLTVKNRVLLSPLAGVSEIPFRRICAELGAGLTYVEMLSATAINHASKPTMHMMARHDSEGQLGVQITGPTAAETAEAAKFCEQEGFETIDINMGCPVRKIVGKGWGAAILQDPQRVEDTVKACKDAVSIPVTAKIRLGWNRQTLNVDEISHRIAEAGADMLTIHGRCRSEDYKAKVDFGKIKEGFDEARAVRSSDEFPFLGNGNVFCAESGQQMMDESGSDGVLISRGSLGNPWVFSQLLEMNHKQPRLSEWHEVVMRHIDYQQEHFGDNHLATIKFRKHLLWYVSGFRRSRHMRSQLSTVDSLGEVRRRIDEFVADQRDDAPRYYNDPNIRSDFDPKYEMDRKHDRGVGHHDGVTEHQDAAVETAVETKAATEAPSENESSESTA